MESERMHRDAPASAAADVVVDDNDDDVDDGIRESITSHSLWLCVVVASVVLVYGARLLETEVVHA